MFIYQFVSCKAQAQVQMEYIAGQRSMYSSEWLQRNKIKVLESRLNSLRLGGEQREEHLQLWHCYVHICLSELFICLENKWYWHNNEYSKQVFSNIQFLRWVLFIQRPSTFEDASIIDYLLTVLEAVIDTRNQSSLKQTKTYFACLIGRYFIGLKIYACSYYFSHSFSGK